MKRIILIFFTWLLIVNIFAVLALNRFNLKADDAYPWMNPDEFSQNQNWSPLALRAKWDSTWYLDIARHGYSFKGAEKLSNIAFFPVYPFLLGGLAFILFGNYILAGWIISAVFLFLALVYLEKLVKEFHPKIDPQLPMIFLLIFPTAFFLNAVYTESLFLFLSVACFYYALQKNFWLAGVFGLVAALTRVTGVLLFLPLVVEFARCFGWRKIWRPQFLATFLPPLGTAGFFLFHYLKYGDFFLWLKVEAWWGRAFKINQEHFLLATQAAKTNLFIDALFIAAILVATFFAFKKLRASYGLYMLATVAVALSTGTTMSIGRYSLVLFPLYILLAKIKNENFKQAWILASVLLLAMSIALFVNGYWAG